MQKKHKTSTEDFVRCIYYAIYKRQLTCQQIADMSGLDRTAIARYLDWMVDMCIVEKIIKGKRNYYLLDQFIRFKMESKGGELIKERLNKPEIIIR